MVTNFQLNVKQDYQEEENYNYPEIPVYTAHGLLSGFENYSALAHRHFDFEFNYIISGEMRFFSQGTIYDLKQGDLIFLNSNCLHYGFSDGKEADFYCVKFSPLLLSPNEYYSQEIIFPFLKDGRDAYVFHNDKEITDFIYSIMNQYSQGRPNFSILMSILYQVFDYLTKNIPVENSTKDKKDVIALTNMVEYIEKQYSNHISLEDIAKSGYITRNKACLIFKEYFVTTPNDYLLSVRLQHAKNMLAEGGKISDIAYACGFSSSSYFTICFKKYYHVSPKSIKKYSS